MYYVKSAPCFVFPDAPMTEKWSGYWRRYLTYDELTAALKEMCGAHPDKAELISIGRSLLGRELWTVEVGGVDAKYTRRNPPPGDWLERECN